ncbi:MAG: zf-HC2 domain-containing protein [bacterium]
MRCGTAKRLAVEALDGRLTPRALQRLERHLSRCRACAARRRETAFALDALRGDETPEMPGVFWSAFSERVSGRVEAESRGRRAGGGAAPPRRVTPVWKPALALATAAFTVSVLSTTLAVLRRGAGPETFDAADVRMLMATYVGFGIFQLPEAGAGEFYGAEPLRTYAGAELELAEIEGGGEFGILGERPLFEMVEGMDRSRLEALRDGIEKRVKNGRGKSFVPRTGTAGG